MTQREQQALRIASEAIARGKSAVTSSLVAAQADEPFETRRWAGVLCSLADKGLLVQHKNAFLGKTFWTLP